MQISILNGDEEVTKKEDGSYELKKSIKIPVQDLSDLDKQIAMIDEQIAKLNILKSNFEKIKSKALKIK